ncbi:hypothetical protein L3X38_038112 [Prunus dulcis]|uniref:Uncharacterized protein n=1 Tax=Prunus dulcis TaxID=3755 RepID=A0AAD4V4P3_PRUDU|nr:hypothetical protein L3X38_038112 [Prunus dulcis]
MSSKFQVGVGEKVERADQFVAPVLHDLNAVLTPKPPIPNFLFNPIPNFFSTMSETDIEENIQLAKQLFVAIKKQHELQEFVKMDQKSLNEKSRLSEVETNKLHDLNAVLVHSSSVKTAMWVEFNVKLRELMHSNNIGIADELTQPKSSEELDVDVRKSMYLKHFRWFDGEIEPLK